MDKFQNTFVSIDRVANICVCSCNLTKFPHKIVQTFNNRFFYLDNVQLERSTSLKERNLVNFHSTFRLVTRRYLVDL